MAGKKERMIEEPPMKKMPMREEIRREKEPEVERKFATAPPLPEKPEMKEKSPEAEKAKDDANAAKEKVKAAGAPGPEKPKVEGPEAAKEAALKKAGEAIKGES